MKEEIKCYDLQELSAEEQKNCYDALCVTVPDTIKGFREMVIKVGVEETIANFMKNFIELGKFDSEIPEPVMQTFNVTYNALLYMDRNHIVNN